MNLGFKDGWQFGLGFWLAGLVISLLPLLIFMLLNMAPVTRY